MGEVLWIDLEKEDWRTTNLDPEISRQYLGGTGLAAHLLFPFSSPVPEPLSPENPLVFATGPLTGTRIPLSGRWAVAARSPLTGLWGDADCGSSFAPMLKAAGYDALVITGRAARPSYLWLHGGEVEIRPAGHVWGEDSYSAHDALRADTHPKAGIACIGPAGERLVPMAGIMSDGSDGRTAARCGLGAVMGSKLLKAVVAWGEAAVPVADPGRLSRGIKAAAPVVVRKTVRLKEHGSAGGVTGNALLGDMTARNWTDGNWVEPAQELSGERMTESILTSRYYCPSCVVGCGRIVRVPGGLHAGTEAGGPEYETLAGFGAQLLITDLSVVAEANDWCNRYGLDTISASGAIAFALEARERGMLTVDPNLEDLDWGRPEPILRLLHKVARREGIGDLICRGVRAMAEHLGAAAGAFAIHVKGLEFPYHDPRALSSLAVNYATHPRGACHRGCTHNLERYPFPELGYPEALNRHAEEGKGKAAAIMQNYAEVYNCLKLCQFEMSALTVAQIVDWLEAVTGDPWSAKELLAAGERSINLKRLFNLRCGARPEDDRLPERIRHEAHAAGNSAGYLPNLELMLQEYYQTRGWDQNAVPLPATLARLRLPVPEDLIGS